VETESRLERISCPVAEAQELDQMKVFRKRSLFLLSLKGQATSRDGQFLQTAPRLSSIDPAFLFPCYGAQRFRIDEACLPHSFAEIPGLNTATCLSSQMGL